MHESVKPFSVVGLKIKIKKISSTWENIFTKKLKKYLGWCDDWVPELNFTFFLFV